MHPRLLRAARALLLALSCLLFATSVQGQVPLRDETSELTALLALIRERLALMPAVAAYKYRHQLPVLDTAREEQLLARTVEQAEALGLDGDGARALFSMQMAIARALQERTLAELKERGPGAKPVLDLTRVLRPKLERIGQALLLELSRAQPALAAPGLITRQATHVHEALAPLGVSVVHSAALLSALSQLRPGRLDLRARIEARKELRVGTTGDYAPFSLEKAGTLAGSDIARARRFARSLGVGVRFVRTSWSSLMDDYARGAFDIAASGISVTKERSAVARFSLPYYHGGKTAIARCRDRDKLNSLAALDQPHVRVIVNPGGTNERFARSQLSHADLRVFPDNRTIFAEIIAGRADVMVSDDVEVALQTKLHPELCRTTRELFVPADKAWLVQPDEQLARELDAWWARELRSTRSSGAPRR